MKNHTICILGGTGFVGHHLANRLARQGNTVQILTRRRERHRALRIHHNIRLIEANVLDPEMLQQQFTGVSAVINLIGVLNETGGADGSFQAIHAELPRRIAQAAVHSGVPRLLHMSALNADPGERNSRYLQTKGIGEDHAHAAAEQGLAVTSFRPSIIFGPGDSFFNRFATLLRLTPLVFPLACPASRFAPVYVGDVTGAFCRALEDDATRGRRLELCGPETRTLRELVEYTRDLLGMKQEIIGLGDGLSRLQARVLGLLPGRPFTMDNYHSLQKDSTCRENALPALGIPPTPMAAVVPGYLADRTTRGRYDSYRRAARRQ
ncbi:MAG: complex I NDUFA9 subunit family protein [Gammaproteobacteria bacterium]|jgi:NADH dehydrogenase